MPYCPNCGAGVQASNRFCQSCGAPLPSQVSAESTSGAQGVQAATAPRELAIVISMERIVLMTILSYGSYLLYWFYVTWKHYRDHIKRDAYPVWHALTLFVPVYDLFRMHAHVRSFKELALASQVRSSLSPGWAVAGIAVLLVLGTASALPSFFLEPQESAIASAFLDLLGIGVTIWVLVHVQTNLNSYWRGLKNVTVTSARTGTGEIVFGVIGIIFWLGAVVGIVGLV